MDDPPPDRLDGGRWLRRERVLRDPAPQPGRRPPPPRSPGNGEDPRRGRRGRHGPHRAARPQPTRRALRPRHRHRPPPRLTARRMTPSLQKTIPEKEMPIVITWPETTEYLDIDLDHLDSDSIEKIEETKEWWPSTRDWYPGEGVFVYWRVECSLVDGGNRITVKHTQGRQDDKHILKYNEQCEDSAQDSFGETSVFVKWDPKGRPRMVGTCYWNCENPDWSCRGRWKATGRPRSRVSREQWDRESGFRSNVLARDERCVISGEETLGKCWMRRTFGR